MNDPKKQAPIKLGRARQLTKTDWTGVLAEFDTPILFRKMG